MNRQQRRAREAKERKIVEKAWEQMRVICNLDPNLLHENDYTPMDCVLCGANMPTLHDTHNAAPLAPNQQAKAAKLEGNVGRCCSKCDKHVLYARLEAMGLSTKNVSKYCYGTPSLPLFVKLQSACSP